VRGPEYDEFGSPLCPREIVHVVVVVDHNLSTLTFIEDHVQLVSMARIISAASRLPKVES